MIYFLSSQARHLKACIYRITVINWSIVAPDIAAFPADARDIKRCPYNMRNYHCIPGDLLSRYGMKTAGLWRYTRQSETMLIVTTNRSLWLSFYNALFNTIYLNSSVYIVRFGMSL